MNFSGHTVIAAIEVLEERITETSRLTRLFLKLGSELNTRCDAGSMSDRFNHLIKYLDEKPERLTRDGLPLADALVGEALSSPQPSTPLPSWMTPVLHSSARVRFLAALSLDGYTVADGKLQRTLPAELALPQAQDDVTRLLNKYGFTTLKGHLDQALDAHTRGDWAAANSQLRTFFEGLFDEIAIALDPPAATLNRGASLRDRLLALKFFNSDLNEWGTDQGKNFVNGMMKRLHPAGSHPGLSDQEDSTFRRHMVLLTAKLFLVRFDVRMSPP